MAPIPGTEEAWNSSPENPFDAPSSSSTHTRPEIRLPEGQHHHSPNTNRFPLPKILQQPRRTFKTWMRCTIVFGVMMVLVIYKESAAYMGQAALFSAILAVLMPPSFALSIFIIAATVLLIGMLIGWAWSCAAMAAALAVRSSSLLATQQLKLQSMLNPTSSMSIPDQIQFHTLSGIFLDPWSSAVHGIFLFVGSFALGALRSSVPRLALLSIFGILILDVVATMAPLLPTARYTLVKLFFIPIGIYLGVAIASIIFIFPESLSHIWLTSFHNDFIIPVQELLTLLNTSLGTSPSDHERWKELTDQGNEIRARMIDGTDLLMVRIALIDLDVSVGRLGPEELKKICGELKGFFFRVSSLHSFHVFVSDKNKNDQEAETLYPNPSFPHFKSTQNLLQSTDSLGAGSHNDSRYSYGAETDTIPLHSLTPPTNPSSLTPTVSRTPSSLHTHSNLGVPNNINNNRHSAFYHLQSRISQVELQHGHDFDSLLPILAISSIPLRTASVQGVQCFSEWIIRCNSNRLGTFFKSTSLFKRFFKNKDGSEDLDAKHAEMEEVAWVLEQRLREFRLKERVRVIGPYEKFFDPVTKKMKMDGDGGSFTSRSLYLSFVFIDTLDAFCESLLKILRVAIAIDAERKVSRIWFPGRSRFTPSKLKENITGQEDAEDEANGNAGGNVNSTAKESDWGSDFMDDTNRVKRDPDALPPTSVAGKMYLKLCAFFTFLKSAEGLFALRCSILSVGLWVPSVCKSSAWFYYEQKGMWALIMGQMALDIYAGDQIASFVLRMVGTVIGLVIGIILWYMGAGKGNGNPYALVVVTTVLLSPFIYLRVIASQRMSVLWIMVAVTGVFVVGYSWMNANLPSIGNPGIGINLGWKRALLVMVGFTGAFIVMIIPNLQSSRVLVRKTAAEVITELGRVFGGEIEAFLAEEARARQGIHEHVVFKQEVVEEEKISVKERRVRRIAKTFAGIATKLRDIEPSLDTARFEPQLAGLWPQNEYRTLIELERRMVTALMLLISSFEKLDTNHCAMLVQQTPYLNPNFIADIFSALSILSSSLLSRTPLPAYLPRLTERLIYHAQVQGHPGLPTDEDTVPMTPRSTTSAGMGGFVLGLSPGSELDEITLDMLLDEQLPAYSTAVVALSSIVTRIDAMSDVVRILCGQATTPGYRVLQRDHRDWEEKVIGSPGMGR